MVITICILVYLLIAFCAYEFVISKWENHSKFEKIYFSVIWILLLPLYGIHWIHNR
jgi:hypothetical protein